MVVDVARAANFSRRRQEHVASISVTKERRRLTRLREVANDSNG